MTTSGIPFADMPLRHTMVTEQNLIIILFQKGGNTAGQRVDVFLIFIIRFDEGQFKGIFFLFINFLSIFNSSLLTAHGIVRV
jgi:hypothetical protein